MSDLDRYLEDSPTLNWLHKHNLPLTRKYFIIAATLGHDDYDWTEEDEMGLPEPLRDFDALARERAARGDTEDGDE